MQKIKRRLNTGVLIVFFLLVITGIVNIYSASIADHTHRYFYRQILWVITGIGIGFPFFRIDYRVIGKYSFWLYLFSLFLLVAVLLFSPSINGAHRWLTLGPVSFQPSEFTKFTTILYLSFYLSEVKEELLDLKHLMIPLLIVIIPFLLVAMEPDLGTAGIILLIGAFILVIYGISKKVFWASVTGGVAFVAFVWKFLLKKYQKRRIVAFLNPEKDPLGAGYHVIQSKIAIGSGGWFGKGFLKGTQTQFSFLPEQHTDFAFSVFSEEWGFFGVLFVLLLYLVIIMWGIDVALNARDKFGRILATGIVLHILLHTVINLAMITGAFPVVGIPLPLFSYGGTATIVTIIEIALLFNVDVNRYMF